MTDQPPQTPHTRLAQMIAGYWHSQAIYAAAKLGIADLLAEGPRSASELAVASGARPDWLYRLLRALASVGIFAETEDRRFSLTPLAEPLRSGVPGSQRPMALMFGAEHYQVWGLLAEVLVSGENAFEKAFGQPIFDYLRNHPEEAAIFDAAMTSIHGRETEAVLAAYDFSGISVLADIGGGNGSKLSAILQRHPSMRGILFDLPHVVERARWALTAAGVSDRCDTQGGDFFQAVPAGADAYLLRHIIHDWDDRKSQAILQHCHAAMPPQGRLLLVESVIPSGNEPCPAKFLDLTMMLIPGGQERTEEEYRQLFQASGFELTAIIPTSAEVSVIEGRPLPK